MGKIKVKRKSTLIDMTAMSDVTVLLLTFFMLTSTFLQKEPTQVITPPSVSEKKVEISNVAQVLVATDDNDNLKVYLSIIGEADPSIPEDNPGSWGSEPLRKTVLQRAAQRYNELRGTDIRFTEGELEKFAKSTSFGVPMAKMKEFLALDQTKQDEWLSDLNNEFSGIPMNPIAKTAEGNLLSEFQIWMDAIRGSGNANLNEAMRRTGNGIAVKADRQASFSLINQVLTALKDIKLNKFTVMTALKTEND